MLDSITLLHQMFLKLSFHLHTLVKHTQTYVSLQLIKHLLFQFQLNHFFPLLILQENVIFEYEEAFFVEFLCKPNCIRIWSIPAPIFTVHFDNYCIRCDVSFSHASLNAIFQSRKIPNSFWNSFQLRMQFGFRELTKVRKM